MTREESINKWIIPALKNTWNDKKCEEVLKALEQEPCDDVISREEVIDELNRLGRNAFKDDIDYDNFFAFVDSLPSVIPTRNLDKIRDEIEQLPTKTRTNWDGCCPDIDYPQIEYVDVTKSKLLTIIDKYKAESEE